MLNNILEIAKRSSKGGRVPIKIALLKIHEDANEVNKNGIHWVREYVENNMESAKLMPICAEFCDDKTTPLGHGLTETVITEDGIKEPQFENSETVGVIESVSIEEINNGYSTITVLCGTGYLYSQRYPNFVKWVRTNYAIGNVDTSIEIMGTSENNNKIIYLEDEPTDEFRTPVEFVFSGTAIISLSPADEDAIVLEVAQKHFIKEEQTHMEFDMKEIKSVIHDSISEMNTREKDFESKINELNEKLDEKETYIKEKETCLDEKDKEICSLNATVEQIQKALEDLRKETEAKWAEREALEKELGELKVKERLGELNSAINTFTEDEQKYAESEINSFKENPMDGKVEDIVSKIYAGIGQASKKAKEAKIAELNNAKKTETDVEDIFSEMCAETHVEDEDLNIF